jgi:hypothetical protein
MCPSNWCLNRKLLSIPRNRSEFLGSSSIPSGGRKKKPPSKRIRCKEGVSRRAGTQGLIPHSCPPPLPFSATLEGAQNGSDVCLSTSQKTRCTPVAIQHETCRTGPQKSQPLTNQRIRMMGSGRPISQPTNAYFIFPARFCIKFVISSTPDCMNSHPVKKRNVRPSMDPVLIGFNQLSPAVESGRPSQHRSWCSLHCDNTRQREDHEVICCLIKWIRTNS